MRVAGALQAYRADAVLGVGGSSVCDTIKVARLAMANGVTEADQLELLRFQPLLPATVTSIMLPTTLSAAEFTPFGGVLDEQNDRKQSYSHPSMPPDHVVLDPHLASLTPARLWRATGMRAVDHAIETWCSIDRTPFSDATALHGLRLLVRGLQALDHAQPEAAADCQAGAWLAIQGLACGVNAGASHGIGHALGGVCGMPHGETSCVMLPHVLRYNAMVNGERQAALAEAMGQPSTPVADLVCALVAASALPSRLRDAGVPFELLPQVANAAMADRWVRTNPRVVAQQDVLDLLNAAW